MSGFMHPAGPPEGPPLAMPGQQFSDEAGIWAAFLVQASLLGGAPSAVIDQSVHEVGLLYRLGTEQYQLAGRIKSRETNFGAPPSGTWRFQDGMVDIGVHSPSQWEAFLDLVDRPPVLCDEVYRDRQMRIRLFDVLGDIVAELLAPRSATDFVEAAQKAGLPCALSLTGPEFVRQAQVRERRYLTPSTREGTGSFEMPGRPFVSEPALAGFTRSAPSLGQDNVSVYLEELGHGPAELEGWRADALV